MAGEVYRIHPAIGFARVGNSDEYFIGPEAPGVFPQEVVSGRLKDKDHAIKRQGARFRIYEYPEEGGAAPSREITLKDADITWTVELANTKASGRKIYGVWFRGFPRSVGRNVLDLLRGRARNSGVRGLETRREQLEIRPGEKSISGDHTDKIPLEGLFRDQPVTLGHLLTDSLGHLVVLGGFGKSASPRDRDLHCLDPFNNDEWYDDISDGPVRATIRLKGRDETNEADPAWVIVGPPDFAPQTLSIVTLFDAIYDVAATIRRFPSTEVSYARDIYPILERAVQSKWVQQAPLDHHYFNHQVLGEKSDAQRLKTIAQILVRLPQTSGWDPIPIPAASCLMTSNI